MNIQMPATLRRDYFNAGKKELEAGTAITVEHCTYAWNTIRGETEQVFSVYKNGRFYFDAFANAIRFN